MVRVMWKQIVHRVYYRLKDVVHPVPEHVDVYAGENKLDTALAQSMIKFLELPNVHMTTSFSDHKQLTLYINDDDDGIPCDCFTMIRYFGRFWRTYPSHPENAILVDASMEKLSSFLNYYAYNGNYVAKLELKKTLTELEASVDIWLHSFDSKTIADISWFVALRYLDTVQPFWDECCIDFPKLHSWWICMSSETI